MSGNRDDGVKYWSQMRQGAGALKNASIMMVDDEILVMEVLKALLQQQGYSNFTLVSDSKLAFDTVLDQQPDVLLIQHCIKGQLGITNQCWINSRMCCCWI